MSKSIAVNEVTDRVYVGVEGGLIVIDGETNEVVAEIPLEFDPNSRCPLAINSQTNRIFVGGWSQARICVIDGDTNRAVGEIPEMILSSEGIAVNPITNFVYIADPHAIRCEADRVAVYDGETLGLVASVAIPGSDECPYVESVFVAVNPATNRIYAIWTGDYAIYVINGDTHRIVDTVELSSLFLSDGVMVNSFTNYVYTCKPILNEYYEEHFPNVVLDGTTWEELSEYEGEIEAVDPLHNLLYTRKGNTLYVLDGTTHEILTSLGLGYWPILAANPRTGRIYLAHGNQVSVFQFRTKEKSSTISCSVTPLTARVGEPVTVSGAISPLHGGVDVELTFTHKTKTVQKIVASSDGSFSLVYSPDEAGVWRVSARWVGDEDHEGAVSRSLSFTVEKGAELSTTLVIGAAVVVVVLGVMVFGKRMNVRIPVFEKQQDEKLEG